MEQGELGTLTIGPADNPTAYLMGRYRTHSILRPLCLPPLPFCANSRIQIWVALRKFRARVCIRPDSTISKLWTYIKSANTKGRTLYSIDRIKMADDHDVK